MGFQEQGLKALDDALEPKGAHIRPNRPYTWTEDLGLTDLQAIQGIDDPDEEEK